MSNTPSSLKLVVFDLDGTLVDTIKDLTFAVNEALDSFGFPKRSCGDVTDFVGNGTLKLIERALPDGKKDAETVSAVHSAFTESYARHYADSSLPYSGMYGLVKELKERGLKLAVLSNKPDRFTKELVEKFYGGLFDVILGSSGSTPRKPDPKGELSIISGLGLTPEETLHIGDSDTDVLTAHNAGVRCIGCTWGFRPRQVLENAGADFFADKPSQILDTVKSLMYGEIFCKNS